MKQLKVTSYIKSENGQVIPLDNLTEQQKAKFRQTTIHNVEKLMSEYYSRRDFYEQTIHVSNDNCINL